jgi:hypothetical protein
VLVDLNVNAAIWLSWVNEAHAKCRHIRQETQLERCVILCGGSQNAEQVDGRRKPVLIEVRGICGRAPSDRLCPRGAVSVDDNHAYRGASFRSSVKDREEIAHCTSQGDAHKSDVSCSCYFLVERRHARLEKPIRGNVAAQVAVSCSSRPSTTSDRRRVANPDAASSARTANVVPLTTLTSTTPNTLSNAMHSDKVTVT